MKRLLIVLVSMMYVCDAMTQNVKGQSMLDDGNSWRYVQKIPDWKAVDDKAPDQDVIYNTIECELIVAGDTVVDDHQCKKIYYRADDVNRLVCITYADEGKIYAKSLVQELLSMEMDNYDKWTLLYDFNATENTSMGIGGSLRKCTLSLIGNVDINGESHLYQQWETESGKYQIVIENIGCEKGLFWVEDMANNGASTIFIGLYRNGNSIFTSDDFQKVEGVVCIANAKRTSTPKYSFNLQGRPVVGTPKRGIYVKEGKKYVVK